MLLAHYSLKLCGFVSSLLFLKFWYMEFIPHQNPEIDTVIIVEMNKTKQVITRREKL